MMTSAQEGSSLGTYTPYSLYGLGDFATVGTSTTIGMGGVGMGVRNKRAIDVVNPAGASARDSLVFVIDFGGEMRNIYAASATTSSSFNSANFHHLAVAFPVWGARFGVNLGFQPYTRVGYDIERRELDPSIINAAGDVRYQYKGEDGLSQVFLNVGYNITPNWAVGVGAKYYFGTINRYYNTLFRSNSYFFNTSAKQSLQVNGFTYSLGTQYTHALNKEQKLTMGVMVSPKINVSALESISSIQNSVVTNVAGYVDTAYSRTNDSPIAMPTNVALGLSFAQSDKWLVGADFAWCDWSKTVIGGRSEMGTSYEIKLGGAYTPDRYDVRYYRNRMTYRAGLRYGQMPLRYDNQSVKDKAVSAGLCFPLKGIGDLNFSAEYGQRGTTKNGGVRENYVNFTLSLTLFEYWFMKYQYE
ncbi:hypothetical protein FACS189452_04410 [Bacteroidia bacterium]|nr:hypothetical protein FACS189452_04410 [Bacteroidia bacterium]GHT81224.1 hypothetical protein FACS189467_4900 [Bacteroidia bacterium]